MGVPAIQSAFAGAVSGPLACSLFVREEPPARDRALDALVDCARAGDAGAFREVTLRVGPALIRYLQRSLGLDHGTAQDLVQDALVLAWCNLDQIHDGAHLRPWLYRVARYRGVSWIRRQGPRGRRMLSLDERPLLGGADDDPAERNRSAEQSPSLVALRHAVGTLSPNHAGVVRLHYLLGLDTTETAQLLGVTRGTVKMRLFRARRALVRGIRAYTTRLAPQDAREVLRWLAERDEQKGRA